MIKKVEASFDKQKKELNQQQNDNFQNDFQAPNVSGEYPVEVKAYDESGNVAVANPNNTAGMVMSVTKWEEPKTDWKETDRFNIHDYNRIKRNLEYLCEKANGIYSVFNVEDMGKDKESYGSPYYNDEFNKFEDNLEQINKNTFFQDFGATQHFFENGAYIQWRELNRIESAILRMKQILDFRSLTLRKLPFTLGRYREVRI